MSKRVTYEIQSVVIDTQFELENFFCSACNPQIETYIHDECKEAWERLNRPQVATIKIVLKRDDGGLKYLIAKTDKINNVTKEEFYSVGTT